MGDRFRQETTDAIMAAVAVFMVVEAAADAGVAGDDAASKGVQEQAGPQLPQLDPELRPGGILGMWLPWKTRWADDDYVTKSAHAKRNQEWIHVEPIMHTMGFHEMRAPTTRCQT